MVEQIKVNLSAEDYRLLLAMAEKEVRTVNQQAQYIIRQATEKWLVEQLGQNSVAE